MELLCDVIEGDEGLAVGHKLGEALIKLVYF